MNQTATPAPVVISYRDRDDYGRSVLYTQVNGRVICARVTLPKIYRETYGPRYFVADWTTSIPERASDCNTIAEAREVEAAILAKHLRKLAEQA